MIPIVSKIIVGDGYFNPYRPFDLRDDQLEEFLEEQMRRLFGVIGSNECQHLREQLEEAKRNDPYAFEHLARQLLEKYVKLVAKIRHAEKLKKPERGPPDRFSELRKKQRQFYPNW